MLKKFKDSKKARDIELGKRIQEQSQAVGEEVTASAPVVPTPPTDSKADTKEVHKPAVASGADPQDNITSSVTPVKRGRPAVGTKKAKITLAIESELKDKFRAYCEANHMLPSDLIDKLLRTYLEKKSDALHG